MAKGNISFGGCILIYLIASCSGAGLGEMGREIEKSDSGLYPLGVESNVQDSPTLQRAKRYPDHLGVFDITQWVRVGECPETSVDGNKLFYCPSLTPEGKHACVDDHQLCDGKKDCSGAEDEDKNYCFFYKALKAQVDNVERGMGTLGQILHSNSQRYNARTRKYGKK